MKKTFACLATFVLAANIAASAYAQSADQGAGMSITEATAQGKEKNPLMAASKKALLVAKKALTAATQDYSGHRARAIAYVDAAVREIDTGVADAEAKSKKQ